MISGGFRSFFVLVNAVGERSTAKNYYPINLLSVVSKVLEKLAKNRIVDHLEKCFFSSSMVLGILNHQQVS